MSTLLQDVPTLETPRIATRREGKRWGPRLALLGRWFLGVLLCTQYLTSLLAVGWTFRLMRRQTLCGWWRRSPARDSLTFEEFARRQGPDIAGGLSPRWLVAEDASERLAKPGRDGAAPSRWRRAARLPRVLLAGLWANARTGLIALACTAALTLPGGLLMLGGWEYGWNVSFNKGYEQAFVGRSVWAVGGLLFVAAMLYVPMAWAHLATTGDPRAFFEFRFVSKLIRHRLGALTFFTAVFALLMFPATVFWSIVLFLPQIFEWLPTATPEQWEQFANRFTLVNSVYLFTAYVLVHLLASRIYRGAVLGVLARRPEMADSLHPALSRALGELRLLPEAPARRRHPLVAVVLGTGRRGKNAVLWVASFLIWLTVLFQLLLSQFLVYHEFLVWLNPMLIHLPSLPLSIGGPA